MFTDIVGYTALMHGDEARATAAGAGPTGLARSGHLDGADVGFPHLPAFLGQGEALGRSASERTVRIDHLPAGHPSDAPEEVEA